MKIIIIGQGGHSKVLHDLIVANEDMEIVGYLDDKYEYFTKENGLYVGPIITAIKITEYFEDIKFIIGIGNNHIRKNIVDSLNLSCEKYISLIHPTSIISPSVKIGLGTAIMPYSVINADTEIGNHAIINTRAVIEHDCKIDSFTHISPNATITGGVEVLEGAHIGAAATVIPTIKIGEWSIIGAGATVVNLIPAHCTAVGIPAKIKMKEGDKLVQ